MKNIYCIVGPSGCGKSTLAEALEKEYGYKQLHSYTTRPPRYEGEGGYNFVSPEEFKALGEMCAYTKFDGYEYGVTADLIEQNDLYVVDPAGVDFLREQYHGSKNVYVIGLTVDTAVAVERMRNRGDSPEKIEKRLANDAVMFKGFTKKVDLYFETDFVSVDELCEEVHEWIRCVENPYKHEFSLLDETGRVRLEASFYSMSEALTALMKIYPSGLPEGWCVRDDTQLLRDKIVDAIKKLRPSFNRSMIDVKMESYQFSRSDIYSVVPFTYNQKEFVYREHNGEGWVDEVKPRLDDKIAEVRTAQLNCVSDVHHEKENDKGGKEEPLR